MFYYYDAFFTAARFFIFAILLFAYKEKLQVRGWFICIFVVLGVLTIYYSFDYITPAKMKNLSLYGNIMSSDKIEAYYGGASEGIPIEFEFSREDSSSSEPDPDVPIYAKRRDVESICWVKFEHSDSRFMELVEVCKVKNPGAYPDAATVFYNGNMYCFLSGRFLYKGSFFYLHDHYAQPLIKAILENRPQPQGSSVAAYWSPAHWGRAKDMGSILRKEQGEDCYETDYYDERKVAEAAAYYYQHGLGPHTTIY